MTLAFDFFVTLTDHPEIRAFVLSRILAGDQIHIVSAISPGLPMDNDAFYQTALHGWGFSPRSLRRRNLGPEVIIHRVDHIPAEKARVLREIGAEAFWDDDIKYVEAARAAGIPTCHVGVDQYWFAHCAATSIMFPL